MRGVLKRGGLMPDLTRIISLPGTEAHGMVSEHFDLSEFACKGKGCCGGAVKVDRKLVAGLEKLRAMVVAIRPAGKIVLNCGYRCPAHNKEVGGVPTSEHVEGCACDIKAGPTLLTVEALAQLCEQVPEFVRFGRYPGRGFVHASSVPSISPNGKTHWTG